MPSSGFRILLAALALCAWAQPVAAAAAISGAKGSTRIASSPAPILPAGPSLASPSPLGPLAPSSLAPSPMAPSLSISPQPAAPAAEAALSPERAQSYEHLIEQVGAPQAGPLGGEAAKVVSDQFFQGGVARFTELPTGTPQSSSLGSADGALSRGGAAAGPSGRTPSQPARPKASLRQRLRDRYFYSRTYAHHLWWYTVTHMGHIWPAYREKFHAAAAADVELSISRPREFFSYMRVMGESGVFYVLGFSSLKEELVLTEARAAFRKYFRGPGVGETERAAFEHFLNRAHGYNAEKRAPSNMRKHVRDAMLAGSAMPGEKLAAYFDGLLSDRNSQETKDFQLSGQQVILDDFRRVILDEIRAEDPRAPDRIVGGVLLGSFASGSANPRSDFDLQVMTANGQSKRVEPFSRRVMARWAEGGRHARNPVSIHESPLTPSIGVLSRIHNGDYMVISPDEGLISELERKPGDVPLKLVREMTWPGRFGRLFQFAAVYATTLWLDLTHTKS